MLGILLIIGAYVYYSSETSINSKSKALINGNSWKIFSLFKNKCGDGICDAKEQANPKLCPKDCATIINTFRFKETTYSLTMLSELGKNLGMLSELGKIIDVNNDGLLDVVVLGEKRESGKKPEGFVNIFYQNNEGKLILSENTYSIQHGADMINAGDVNNDGLNDIVITTDDVSANVTAFLIQKPLNTFSLSFEPAPDLPTSAGSPDIGDLNGDGLNDVVRGNKPRGSISIYNQNLKHNLKDPPLEIFVGGEVKRWRTSDGRIGDFNNDGKNDFAVRNGVLLNGNAFFTVFYHLVGNNKFNITNYDTGITSDMGLSDIRSADMDNNDLADVVISINEGDIGVYLQVNGGLKGTIYSSGLHSIRGIALGDIDGDGKKDIVASSFNCREGVSILIQNTNGSYNAPIRISSPSGFGGMVEMGDVNNDSKNEIVTTNGLTLQTSNCPESSISVIEMNIPITDSRCNWEPGLCKNICQSQNYYFDSNSKECKKYVESGTNKGCCTPPPFETLEQCNSVCK